MKKAEEYLKQLFEEPFNLEEGSIEWDFLQVIKQAQIDAIEETCRVCAESADLTEFKIAPQDIATIEDGMGDIWGIDKQSILSVSDKLKKELE